MLNGTDLRARRQAMSLSQTQLGGQLGIPSNTIARWERGEMVIQQPYILELALERLEDKTMTLRERQIRRITWMIRDALDIGRFETFADAELVNHDGWTFDLSSTTPKTLIRHEDVVLNDAELKRAWDTANAVTAG
jgi:transcriptional regulator with XRE-family HTH domain